MSRYFRAVRPKHVVATAAAALLVVGAAGCDAANTNTPGRLGMTPTTSAVIEPQKADNTDYSRLLVTSDDISVPPQVFTTASSKVNPNGLSGASALFVNDDDTQAVAATLLIYPDAATATATLHQAVASVGNLVAGGTPRASSVGTGGTAITGQSPDGTKAVTMLLFTEGPALMRLEFDSAPGAPTNEQFVTYVGKMQDVALRVGLDEDSA